jgi:hypothetical protein
MLNAANAARFFYPQYIPAEHQSIPQFSDVTKGVIAYEGLIKNPSHKMNENLQGPVAQGDGPLWVPGKNPPVTQFSVYGSGHVGIFGSIIRPTNVKGILQLDLLATDFFHDKAYPTFLYYNPYSANKKVTLPLEQGKKFDLYNTVSASFIAKSVSDSAEINLPSAGSAVVVCIPSGGKISYDGHKMLVNGIVIDYKNQSNH